MENNLQHLPEWFLLAFLGITFLQSGLDKILDFRGNLQWLQGHFEDSFLKKGVPLMLSIVLVLETVTGILAFWGIISWILDGSTFAAWWAAAGACLTLLCLLFGQRVAKDYDGARTIVIYFIPAVFLLFLLS